MEKQPPSVEAIAFRGDRIVALGANNEVQPWIGPATRVVSLTAASPCPGSLKVTATSRVWDSPR